jgi:hypothetical protein
MDGSIFVPISFFAMIAAIVIVPKYLRSRDRDRLHETLRMAYEKGQPVPPELMEALQPTGKAPPDAAPYVPVRDRAERDLRSGVVWLAIGVGLLLIGAAFYAMLYNVGGAVETGCSFAALAAIPLCVGLAFLLLSALGRKRPS